MYETDLHLSENGWEYAGIMSIRSKTVPKTIDDNTIEVDGVRITFDEEIRIVNIDKNKGIVI